MLGDTAVAVHPDDVRYKAMLGKKIVLPLIEREYPDNRRSRCRSSAFGSGAVKITPAHDFNDFADGPAAQSPADFRDGYAWADERRSRPVSRDDARGLPRHGGRGPDGAGSAGEDRAASACRRRLLALRDGGRADALQSVVRAGQAAGRGGACGGARRPHDVPSEALGEHLFQLDGECLRLVHLAPTMVGPSHSRVLVRALRRDDGRGRAPGDMLQVRRRRPAPGRGRARYLVQLGAVAVFDPGMARRDARACDAIIRRACSSPASTSFFSGSRG